MSPIPGVVALVGPSEGSPVDGVAAGVALAVVSAVALVLPLLLKLMG